MYHLEKSISDFKDYHNGEVGFICFNGKHILDISSSKIKGYPTFVLDSGCKLDKLVFNYLVTIKEKIADELNHISFSIGKGSTYKLKFDDSIPMFQTNIINPLYTANSSGYLAIQLAYCMGISPLVLLGLDTVTDVEILAFELARKAFNDDDREIYNGSSYTSLSYKVIPKISLDIFNN